MQVTDFYLSGIVAAGLKRTCLVDVRCSAPETFDGPHLMASDVYRQVRRLPSRTHECLMLGVQHPGLCWDTCK